MIVATFVGVLLAGCGEAKPQSKAQFVIKTNEICTSMATGQRRALDKIGNSYAGSADDLADAIDSLRDLIATRLERIKDLGQPSDPPNAYTATLRTYAKRLQSVPSADPVSGMADPGPVQRLLVAERPRLVREAKAYGIEGCRALDAKPLPLIEQPLGGGPPPR